MNSDISKINLYCQKLRLNPPFFEILKKEGTDHHPIFYVSCAFENHIQIGDGTTLKMAKENAAAKIVNMLEINLKLQELQNKVVYTVDSYNTSLSDIWNNTKFEYTKFEHILTLKRKDKNGVEYKNFKVKIKQNLEC